MPLIRHIVKLLNALPMQNNIKSKRKLLTAIDSLLQNKKTIHFYPEAALWPYYDKLSKEEKERDLYLRTLDAMSEKMKGNSHEKY